MHKLLALILASAFLPAAPALRAAGLVDLGQGLGYLRVHSLAEPLAALGGSKALVLDLRYCTGNDESAAALRAALVSRSATAPLIVLVSPGLPAPVTDALASAKGIFTLGIIGSKPEPRVIVKSDAATDRRAYDALDAGIPIATLISGKVEKERFDEAELVKEFKNGNPDAEPPPGPDPTAPKKDEAAKPAPLVDRVLQRAVHLHHGLLALKAR